MSRPRFIAMCLALVTLAAYLPATGDGFSCYDDGDYVTNNRVVQNGLTWAGTEWAFTTWQASNWHPLTWLSHMLDCELFGLNAWAPHCVNILLHTANAILLLVWLLRLTGALWTSAFVAALFAWHPLHVESVAWISERKDVLSTFFEILALLAYTHFVLKSETGNQKSRTLQGRFSTSDFRPPTSGHYWLALFFFALGLMAKPMLVTLPFVLLLLDYWPLRRFSSGQSPAVPSPVRKFQPSNLPRLIVEKWPFFVLTAVSCVLTFLAQRSSGAVASLTRVPLLDRLENIPVAYVRYLLKMFWPTHLAVFYPLHFLSGPAVAAAVTILVAISWLVWRIRRPCPYGLAGWFWFLGMLVPVIGLVQVGGAAMADRYTYFPSVGIFLLVTLGLGTLVKRFHIAKPLIVTAAGLVLTACLVLTENQLRYWRSDVALFSHAITVTKDNDIAYFSLGFALQKEGQKAEAMAALRKALSCNPGRAETHNNLANLLEDDGNPKAALAEYQAALRINPNYVAAHENLGTLLVGLGRFDEAMDQYAEVARLDPGDWRAPYLIGRTLLKQGRDREAISQFQQALKIDPNNLPTLTFLAQVLASDENPEIRDGRTAFLLASRAGTQTDAVQPAVLDALGMACAELGRFDDAIKAEQDAFDLAKVYKMTNYEEILQQRLQLFQQHQPYRQSFKDALMKELPEK